MNFVAERDNAIVARQARATMPGDEKPILYAEREVLPTYLASRLLLGIGLLLVLTLLVFTLTRVAGGDPTLFFAGEAITEGELNALREQLGLDKPLPIQYLTWVGNMLRGDFGHSLTADAPVRDLIVGRLPNTLSMLPITMLIAGVISIPLGILAATHRRSDLDRAVGGAAVFGFGVPSICLAIFVILVLVWLFGWLPPLSVGLRQLFWPAFVLGILSGSVMIRVIRSSIVEVLDREAMDLPGFDSGPPVGACLVSCLGNVLISAPALFGGFLAGAVVVEIVFVVPGIGRLLIEAALRNDFPIVEGVVMVAAGMMAIVLGFSLIAGLLVRCLEPRAPPESASDRYAYVADTVPETSFASGPWRVPWVSLIVLGILILTAIVAPIIAPFDPHQASPAHWLASPGDGHLLGTDHIGRDVLSRLIYGARTSLSLALLTLIPVGVVGGGLGLVSAYAGGKMDAIIMGAVDNMLAFPLILLAILALMAWGPGFGTVAIAVSLALWPKVARVTRDEVTALKTGINLHPSRVFNAVMALLTLHIGLAILLEATLRFLGVGAPTPQPSWGSMLAASRSYLIIAPQLVIFSGLALTVVTVALLASAGAGGRRVGARRSGGGVPGAVGRRLLRPQSRRRASRLAPRYLCGSGRCHYTSHLRRGRPG